MTEYKYNRELPTGLGDRLGVYACVATLALTLDINVHTYWTESATTISQGSRYYSSDFIQKHVQFPKNLIFHPKEDFQKLNYPELNWRGGSLPATLAFDCIPALAYHTFNLKSFKDRKSVDEFQKAYQKIRVELQLKSPTMPVNDNNNYGIFHIRAGDKSNWDPLFLNTTQNIIDIVKSQIGNDCFCYIITDDLSCLNKFKLDEEFFKSLPDLQDQNMAMLRDFKFLLEANWIIQHAENGWSAFSNIPACLREIPIINTYPKIGRNVLDNFKKLQGLPKEFHYFDQPDDFIKHAKFKIFKK